MGTLFVAARSPYDFATDEVKQQLAALSGDWGQGVLTPRQGAPVMGQCGYDVAGTLSGFWFYDYAGDPTWGVKGAVFYPFWMDAGKIQIRLYNPGLDLCGSWIMTPNASGNTNLDPKAVTASSGLVYYVLNDTLSDENGLLMVRVNSDETITVETHINVFTTASYPNFTSGAITLKR